jgi:prepilin-type N-terminal cleavage/methylation domain-containing protein
MRPNKAAQRLLRAAMLAKMQKQWNEPPLLRHKYSSKGSPALGSVKNKPACKARHDGFTLIEVLVAMLMLGMVTVMIYSVLNVGIKMSAKGEKAIYGAARQHGVMRLLHDQIISACYDNLSRKVLISGGDEILRVVTRSPLRYRNDGVVLAIYRYDSSTDTLYYIEKRDYYNTDYNEEYVPAFDDMLVLGTGLEPVSFAVDEKSQAVTVNYGEKSSVIVPKCADILAADAGGVIQ